MYSVITEVYIFVIWRNLRLTTSRLSRDDVAYFSEPSFAEPLAELRCCKRVQQRVHGAVHRQDEHYDPGEQVG